MEILFYVNTKENANLTQIQGIRQISSVVEYYTLYIYIYKYILYRYVFRSLATSRELYTERFAFNSIYS